MLMSKEGEADTERYEYGGMLLTKSEAVYLLKSPEFQENVQCPFCLFRGTSRFRYLNNVRKCKHKLLQPRFLCKPCNRAFPLSGTIRGRYKKDKKTLQKQKQEAAVIRGPCLAHDDDAHHAEEHGRKERDEDHSCMELSEDEIMEILFPEYQEDSSSADTNDDHDTLLDSDQHLQKQEAAVIRGPRLAHDDDAHHAEEHGRKERDEDHSCMEMSEDEIIEILFPEYQENSSSADTNDDHGTLLNSDQHLQKQEAAVIRGPRLAHDDDAHHAEEHGRKERDEDHSCMEMSEDEIIEILFPEYQENSSSADTNDDHGTLLNSDQHLQKQEAAVIRGPCLAHDDDAHHAEEHGCTERDEDQSMEMSEDEIMDILFPQYQENRPSSADMNDGHNTLLDYQYPHLLMSNEDLEGFSQLVGMPMPIEV
ncbi:hypothetical protein KP509_1Z266200 [Ceratopteris richardii]|nr:hypothetical protein KP509_1Z266200 [Ceratopteris richardii]